MTGILAIAPSSIHLDIPPVQSADAVHTSYSAGFRARPGVDMLRTFRIRDLMPRDEWLRKARLNSDTKDVILHAGAVDDRSNTVRGNRASLHQRDYRGRPVRRATDPVVRLVCKKIGELCCSPPIP